MYRHKVGFRRSFRAAFSIAPLQFFVAPSVLGFWWWLRGVPEDRMEYTEPLIDRLRRTHPADRVWLAMTSLIAVYVLMFVVTGILVWFVVTH